MVQELHAVFIASADGSLLIVAQNRFTYCGRMGEQSEEMGKQGVRKNAEGGG